MVFFVALGDELRAESESAESLFPLTLALQWLPQSQFAGFYMALEQGFYSEAGLDVTLEHAATGTTSMDLLFGGEADFATSFLADAIVAGQERGGLVNVAQLFQQSNLMLVAWTHMGVEKPSDLDGRPVSYWQGAFAVAFEVFFQKYGIEPQVIPQHHSINLFLERGVTACSAMVYNEFNRIYLAGIDYDSLTVFRMRDFGLGFPEDGIFTTPETAERYPEVCEALRRATLKGWEYASRNPEEAIDAVHRQSRRYGVSANRAHSRWMLEHVVNSIFPADHSSAPGYLERRAYTRAVNRLKEAGFIDAAPDYSEFAPFD